MSVGITITFGDVAENHVGNQKIGVPADNGITCDELKEIAKNLDDNNISTTLVQLDNYIDKSYFDKSYSDRYSGLEASILVIHNGIDIFCSPDKLFEELKDLPYDKHALMGRGANKKVKNKRAQ